MEEYAILNGQVLTTLNLADLAKAFEQIGVASRLGESSHYTGGHYLHIRQGKAELTFDRIEETEYLVSGEAPSEAPSVEKMDKLAQMISNALQQLALKHRFEVYFPYGQSKLVGYFHHDWALDWQPP